MMNKDTRKAIMYSIVQIVVVIIIPYILGIIFINIDGNIYRRIIQHFLRWMIGVSICGILALVATAFYMLFEFNLENIRERNEDE